MTIPLSIQDQMRFNWFEPNGKYALLFGMSNFDACWKKNKEIDNLYEQAYDNLDTVKEDCKMF